MLYLDGARYLLQQQTNEEKLESMVKEHSKEIFGETSVYFDLKHKLTSKAGAGSIPDAYVVDFVQPYKWYIVEVELAAHSTDHHIMPQLNKFLRGIYRAESQNIVSKAMHNELEKKEDLKTFVKANIGSMNF